MLTLICSILVYAALSTPHAVLRYSFNTFFGYYFGVADTLRDVTIMTKQQQQQQTIMTKGQRTLYNNFIITKTVRKIKVQ